MTAGTHLIRSAEAEQLVFPNGSSMHLLGEALGARHHTMTVHRSVLTAGADGPGPHHHRQTAELIYVVRGALHVLIGHEVTTAGEGDLLMIPPGVPHAFAATGDGEVELLDVVTPGARRFELFRQLAQSANGLTLPGAGSLPPEDSDTYTDDSAVWNGTRRPKALI
jgi:quercetin dioxygenase-like cupin family protein